MPLAVTQPARLSILTLELPGREAIPAGVLLEDPSRDRLHLRLRRDWEQIAPGEAEVLSEIEADWNAQAGERGAARMLAWLEDTLSNVLRIG